MREISDFINSELLEGSRVRKLRLNFPLLLCYRIACLQKRLDLVRFIKTQEGASVYL